MKPLFLLLLFFANHLFGQGLLLNPNFDSINVCFEFESECSFKAWYPIRHGANVSKQSKKNALLSITPQIRFEGQNRTAVVGCLTRPVFPGKEVQFMFHIQNPRNVFLGIGFLKRFEFSTQEDLSKLDSIKFEVAPLNTKEKQIITSTPKDTSLFVVFFLLEDYGSLSPIQFRSIDAKLTVPEKDQYFINPNRIKFILKDRRRHIFNSTQKTSEIMNAFESF